MKTDLGISRLLLTLVLTGLLGHSVQCENPESNMSNDSSSHEYTNHLINENSPYLLSHAHNPVDWYPWGEEALARARELNRPIFLSIGYAACHWCHVMEHESFENEQIAAFLNENYVSIKVDREQRPDIDQIYMQFTMALSGSGGWPMSVFLTPDLKPFFAGTYFPPDDRYGRPGFMSVLTQIATAYQETPEQITKSSADIFDHLKAQLSGVDQPGTLDSGMVTAGARALLNNFDHTNGGFGRDRKFPHAIELALFLRHYHKTGEQGYLDAANQALLAMYRGGLRDHLGGGFARYSVDPQWKIPHFEKMLYDNGLLTITYAEAYQLTNKPEYLDAVTSTLDFILNEMTDRSGGFYSALDADSEGEEGKFYVWTKAELDQSLGDDAAIFCEYYSATAGGNFEGKNHLQLNPSSERVAEQSGIEDWNGWLDQQKQKLLDLRALRIRPLTDDKILASWNGLALAAFARGYRITGDERYLDAAIKNARFVKEQMFANGRLAHSYREGKTSTGEFLEDYAYYLFGLIELAQIDPDMMNETIQFASELADRGVELFMEPSGHLYLREDGVEDLIIRPKDEFDGAMPSPGSILLWSLEKLHRLTDNQKFLSAAQKGIEALSSKMTSNPGGMASALIAVDYLYSDKIELIIVGSGEERDKMLGEINRRFLPGALVAISNDGTEPLGLFEGRQSDGSGVVAYLCLNSACRFPVDNGSDLAQQLDNI